MSFFEELKRRNVVRVGALYVIASWIVLQVADVLFDALELPSTWTRLIVAVLILGFPLALIFAWAFEMTPEGLKRERDVDRSQSVTDTTGRRINVLIVILLVVAIAVVAADRLIPEPPQLTEVPVAATIQIHSVAVLPFVAMNDGPDDDYFADGLTEEILNSLAQLPEILVTARTSAFAFKGQDIPIPDIALKLGVAHVVEGSVRRSGDQLRITAQLIRAADGFHLWSDAYNRSGEDVFGIQAEIAEKIAGALNIVLDEKQLEKMRSVGLRNPEAFIAFQKGVALYDAAHDGETQVALLVEANTWFDKALAISPEFFDALVMHSDRFSHVLIEGNAGGSVSDAELATAIAQVEADLDRAIRFAPDDSKRLAASYDLKILTGKWRGLTRLIREIADKQSCSQPLWGDMNTLAFGMAEVFLTMEELQISCDPLNYDGWADVGRAHNWLGEYELAIDIAHKGLASVTHSSISNNLIYAHLALGQFDQAEAVIDRDLRNEADIIYYQAVLAAAMGDKAKAMKMISDYDAAGFDNADRRLIMRMLAGEPELANQIAAELDSRPYGYLTLMQTPASCLCGAPFDLEFTPNYAKLLADADYSWPPAGSMNWPLRRD
jgi:adenylate cyclase